MPEVYWVNRREPARSVVEESEREWRAMPERARPAIIPIFGAFETGAQPLTPGDLAYALDRYPTCALWSWQHFSGTTWRVLLNRANAAAQSGNAGSAPPSNR